MVADRVAAPVEYALHFTERLLMMPHTYVVNDYRQQANAAPPLPPAWEGLTRRASGPPGPGPGTQNSLRQASSFGLTKQLPTPRGRRPTPSQGEGSGLLYHKRVRRTMTGRSLASGDEAGERRNTLKEGRGVGGVRGGVGGGGVGGSLSVEGSATH